MFQPIPRIEYKSREPVHKSGGGVGDRAGDEEEEEEYTGEFESEEKSWNPLNPQHMPEIIFRRCLNKCKSVRRLKKEQRNRLPNAIIPIQNSDKKFHESWTSFRDWLDFPHPFRKILASKPNSGKTTVIKNILIRTSLGTHPFEHVIVVHCDPDMTSEYSDVQHLTLLSEIPRVQDFQGVCKTLVILEDLNYLSMTKEQKGRLERLFGYASTHKNISCMLTAQDPFRILPAVRRCTNVFVLWRHHDQTMIQTLAAKTGCSAESLRRMMEEHLIEPHDSLWIDLTPNTPAPFRKNGYTEIFSCDKNMNDLHE